MSMAFFGAAAAFTAGIVVARTYAFWGHQRPARQQQQRPPSMSLKHVEVAKGKYKMVLIVNMRLKMGKGKIAAQCGHATLAAYRRQFKNDPVAVKTWHVKGGYYFGPGITHLRSNYSSTHKKRLFQKKNMIVAAKVALKCKDEDELMVLQARADSLGLNTMIIQDAGRTQIEAGSITVLAIGPNLVEEVDQVARHLKLL